MRLKEVLFGKRIIMDDNYFGRIESEKTRRNGVVEPLSWYIHFKMKCFHKETFIVIEGDHYGINSKYKEDIKYFIENFDNYYSKEIDKIVSITTIKDKFKSWRTDYSLTEIYPAPYDESSFEIVFEPVDEKKKGDYVSFDLINRKIKADIGDYFI